MKECASLAADGTLDTKSLFVRLLHFICQCSISSCSFQRGSPWPTSKALSGDDAKASKSRTQCLSINVSQPYFFLECLHAWSEEAFSQVLSVFFFSLLPSLLYYCLVYTYYRQSTDPQHPASLRDQVNGHRSAIRMEAFPGASYSPLYNTYSDGRPATLASSMESNRRSTRDPSPQKKTSTSKTPAKSAKTSRPAALVASSKLPSPRFVSSFVIDSASTFTMSPGPPSFGPKIDASYRGQLPGYEESGFM